MNRPHNTIKNEIARGTVYLYNGKVARYKAKAGEQQYRENRRNSRRQYKRLAVKMADDKKNMARGQKSPVTLPKKKRRSLSRTRPQRRSSRLPVRRRPPWWKLHRKHRKLPH